MPLLFPPVRQLHREFLRAGSNVMQTFTFYASEDKLENRGNYVAEKISVSTAAWHRKAGRRSSWAGFSQRGVEPPKSVISL